MQGTVFDIKRFALHDGAGLRSTAFLKGCPLSCPWCHNPEGIDAAIHLDWTTTKCIHCGLCTSACPECALSHDDETKSVLIDRDACTVCGRCVDECPTGALSFVGRVMQADALADELAADSVFFDAEGGVTLSGGEPLAQPAFAAEVLRICAGRGIHTAVETTLCVPWSAVDAVLPHTSQFIVDLKLADPIRHNELVGGDSARIRENLERLLESGAPVLIRVPVIPGFTDDQTNLSDLGRYVSGLRPQPLVELVNFNPLAQSKYQQMGLTWPIDPGTPRFTDDQMRTLSDHVRAGGAANVTA